MNVAIFITLHRKAIRPAWEWKPKVLKAGDPWNLDGSVWYRNYSWLCFGIQVDNEW